MKHHRLALLLSILTLSALGYAAQPSSTNDKPADQAKKTPFIEYDNRILFLPNHLGYERIKPNAVYAGIESYLLPTFGEENKYKCTLLDVEFRLGYNFFFRGKDHLTPIAGIGYTQNIWNHHDRKTKKPGILYGLAGFLYLHEFSSKFNLGLNGKFLIGGSLNNRRPNWGSPVMGMDIAIPIIFRLGNCRNWDLCIEPFTMYLHGSHAQEWFGGGRSSLAYRF